MPQIREAILKYENSQNRSLKLEWTIDLSFIDNFNQAKLSNMAIVKETHEALLKQESVASNIHLLINYYRGLLYLHVRGLRVNKDVTFVEWFAHHFPGIAYPTIKRYVSFATLIKTYPGLLLCGLNFLQFTKHKTRLLDYLGKDKALADQLRVHVSLTAQGQGVDIEPADLENLVLGSGRLSTDPDYVFETSDWYPATAPGSRALTEKEEASLDDITKFIMNEADETRKELSFEEELRLEAQANGLSLR